MIAALSARDFPAVTRARHAESLKEAHDRLVSALTAEEPELAAEDVRLAAQGEVQGAHGPLQGCGS